MTDLIFNTPWWLPTAIIGVGLFLAALGNRRQQKNQLRTGAAIVLTGATLAAISYYVDTPAEKAVRRTHEIVAAGAARDWPRFQSLLDPGTAIYSVRGPEPITRLAKQAVEAFNITSLRITGTDPSVTPTLISVNIRVLSEQSMGGGVSDWSFEYENLGTGWRLRGITALSNETVKADRVKAEISRFAR